jgi:hypothetical protein
MPGLWDWTPGESVGPIRFGDPADDLIELYDLVKQEPDCSVAYWETYKMPGWESSFIIEDGRLSAICCNDSCLIEGSELLGMSFTDARDFLGPEDGLGEGVGAGYAAYYRCLGLTLWVKENGIIESATCEAPIGDE